MGAIFEIYCSRIASHHNFTHSAMEAQSVYVQLTIPLIVALCIVVIVVSLIFKMAYFLS
jgi:hypothetical protein